MDGKIAGWETISNKYPVESSLVDVTENFSDIILVLAGGLTQEGKLHEWVIRRLNLAAQLHKLHQIPILCCGGGTYHKPPFINQDGFVVHESTECVNYLTQSGVDKNMIYREWSSYDTIANAFFSLTSFFLCNPKMKNITVITSEFHMERVTHIFNWVYNLDGLYEQQYQIEYLAVPDTGLDESMLKSRRERERKSTENVIQLSNRIKTLNDFSEWLYKEHNAYNNNFLIVEAISNDCKNSY